MGIRLMRLFAVGFVCLAIFGSQSAKTYASAAGVTYDAFEAFNVTNPCSGEQISVSGMVHVVFRIGETPSGQFHVVIVEVATDWTVVDESGNAYLSTGQPGQFIVNQASSSDSLSLSLVNRQWFVTPGGEDNVMVRRVRHLQFTPDGTVSSFHDFVSVECRGKKS